MADIMISNVDAHGERRPFAAHGHVVLANAGAAAVLRGSFEPGWHWAADVAPLAGTTSCQVHHLGYVLTGSMRIRLDDGTERDIAAGDVYDLPAGHDAWVTSDVPYLAAGLPVVTTPLPALADTPGVVVAADAPATIAALERALADDGPAARRARSQAVLGNSWDARLDEIASYLSNLA